MTMPITNTVYGGLINLATNEEIEMDGTPVLEVLAQLKALPGTKYGVDWKYAGDLTAEDDDANIYVTGLSAYDQEVFDGKTAVEDFIKACE